MPFLQGKIIAQQAHKVQIEFQTTPKCEHTTVCAHKPAAWRLLPFKAVWFDFSAAANVGDNVVVSLPNSVYHTLLLRLYGLPLLALWLGAGLGEMWGTVGSVGVSLGLFMMAWGVNVVWSAPTISLHKLEKY